MAFSSYQCELAPVVWIISVLAIQAACMKAGMRKGRVCLEGLPGGFCRTQSDSNLGSQHLGSLGKSGPAASFRLTARRAGSRCTG